MVIQASSLLALLVTMILGSARLKQRAAAKAEACVGYMTATPRIPYMVGAGASAAGAGARCTSPVWCGVTSTDGWGWSPGAAARGVAATVGGPAHRGGFESAAARSRSCAMTAACAWPVRRRNAGRDVQMKGGSRGLVLGGGRRIERRAAAKWGGCGHGNQCSARGGVLASGSAGTGAGCGEGTGARRRRQVGAAWGVEGKGNGLERGASALVLLGAQRRPPLLHFVLFFEAAVVGICKPVKVESSSGRAKGSGRAEGSASCHERGGGERRKAKGESSEDWSSITQVMSPTTDLQKGEHLVNVDLMKSCSYKPAGPCTHEYHYTCQFSPSDREQYNGESVENFWPKPKHQTEGKPVDAKKVSQLKGINGKQCAEDTPAEKTNRTASPPCS
ncbi:hypothetical protein B0H14DRAFT_2614042 [Mycena olivaceomarginata]|nr:hypothetical protein B0H14DRAFT_2614042 [Mycena olivaceomarginata]